MKIPTDREEPGGSGCCAGENQTVSQVFDGERPPAADELRQAVRTEYGRIAEEGGGCGCGADPGCCGSPADVDTLSRMLGYSTEDNESVPEGANLGLGCGNPQAIAGLRSGETVVDLGSGAGFDCFLASRQVGETGRVIGVDMTAAMILRARSNALKGNYRNVDFRLGEIEALPVGDATADVIISNCVINLSPDKQRVFAESYRILKPGGRLAVADIVAFAEPPEEIRRDIALYTGCMAGASHIDRLEEMLREAGFEEIRISPRGESRSLMRDWMPDAPITDYFISATIEAKKPR